MDLSARVRRQLRKTYNMKYYLDRRGVRDWWRYQPFQFDLNFVEYVDAYLDALNYHEKDKFDSQTTSSSQG